jgi:hypothetical protein
MYLSLPARGTVLLRRGVWLPQWAEILLTYSGVEEGAHPERRRRSDDPTGCCTQRWKRWGTDDMKAQSMFSRAQGFGAGHFARGHAGGRHIRRYKLRNVQSKITKNKGEPSGVLESGMLVKVLVRSWGVFVVRESSPGGLLREERACGASAPPLSTPLPSPSPHDPSRTAARSLSPLLLLRPMSDVRASCGG